MRKRKPPIVPITLLVVFACIVGYVNYNSTPVNQRPPTPPAATAPRETESKEAVANKLKNSVAAPTTAGASTSKGENPLAPPSGDAMIPDNMKEMIKRKNPNFDKLPKDPSMQKPVPNDSATSTQWYTPETPK